MQTADAADAALAERAAVQAARQAQIVRTNDATATRLTHEATAYAEGRRSAALVTAQAAVVQTETVLAQAVPVVEPEGLSALTAAVAELEALMASDGAAAETGLEPPAQAEVETATEDDGAEAMVSPEAQARQDLDQRASRAGAEGRVPLAVAASEAGTAEPLLGEAGVPLAADEPDVESVPTSAKEALEVSSRMVALAAQVSSLSAEVQATTQARVAEAEARALAEAAAAAAAAERARKVQVAQDSPNGAIPVDVLCPPAFSPDELLRCDAAESLERLNEAYRAEFGRSLDVVSSYRSYSLQVATRRSRGWLAAVPGTSNHGLAVAVDFAGFGGLGNFSTASYRWMKANAQQYGWYHPTFMQPGGGGPQEPWHWEFGTPE